MRRLFHNLDKRANARTRYPQWPTVERGLEESLQRTIHYHQTAVRIVPAQHFLVRLLTSIPISKSLEPQVFFDRVFDVAYRVAGGLRMTTPISRGGIHTHGVFYGYDTAEVIAAVNWDVDVDAAVKDWRNIEAVRVYRHPMLDLDLALPDGVLPTNPAGIAVVVINIALLALQYQCWWKEQLSKPSGQPLTVEHFIAMVALPSMLRRQLDLCLANRVMARFAGVEIPVAVRSTPFSLPDYTRQVDGVIGALLSTQCVRAETFDQWIADIPQVSRSSFAELIDIPPSPLTEPIGWVWLLVQLPLVEYLVKLNSLSGDTRNLGYLREMRLAMVDYANSGLLARTVPEPYCNGIVTTLHENILPYLKV